MKSVTRTTRRNVLKQGTLLLAAVFGGVFGGAFASRGGKAHAAFSEGPRTPTQTKLTLYGRHWHLFSQNRKRGELLAKGDQVATYGELLNSVGGAKIGEFYSNGLHLKAPFGASTFAAANIEVHTFNLRDGSILGMGTSSMTSKAEGDVYAVLSGTGTYQGVRGSYRARQHPQERGGDGTAEFTFSLIS